MKLQTFPGYTFTDGGVCAAQGFKANGVCCGLRHQALSDGVSALKELNLTGVTKLSALDCSGNALGHVDLAESCSKQCIAGRR